MVNSAGAAGTIPTNTGKTKVNAVENSRSIVKITYFVIDHLE
jgi:hypothetical protein